MLLRSAFASSLLGIALAAAPAAAQSTLGTMSMVLQKKIGEDSYRDFSQMEALEFFNYTNCQCHAPFGLELELTAPPGDLGQDIVEIWLGSNCATFEETRDDRCVKVPTDLRIEDLHNRIVVVELDAAALMFPTGSCSELNSNNNVWALIDQGANGSYEHVWSLPTAQAFDALPPPAVVDLTSSSTEDGFALKWEMPTSGVNDIRFFQVLCASSKDGTPVFVEPPSDAEYIRPADVEGCQVAPPTPDAGVPDAGVADAGVPDAGPPPGDAGTPAKPPLRPQNMAAFEALDPAYVCSGPFGPSTERRIDLSNPENVHPLDSDEKILTKLVVMDAARNFRVVNGPAADLPQPVRDAWEIYHDRGGGADGGFCFVATAAYGDYDHPYVRVLRDFRDDTLARSGAGRGFIAWYYEHSPAWAEFLRAHPVWRVLAAVALFPVVALAWLWNAVGLAGLLLAVAGLILWRRRKQRRLAAAVAAAAVLLAFGAPASAQVFLEEGLVEETGPPRSSWAFDIKLGPYYPDVDGESGLSGDPYAETFGDGSSLLFQLELDRFFFYPAGQLGLGASIGYMGNSARAFIQDEAGNPTDERSEDTTTFRMLPLSLSIVYRMTALADRTYVPLVPYAKVGLAYYLWQITKGNGDLSSVNGDDARGGTLGFTGTVGLALRADAIDRDAARALASELGVEHAGFFFELMYANVSGLGLGNRLHLGDLTWAAGVNFEF